MWKSGINQYADLLEFDTQTYNDEEWLRMGVKGATLYIETPT